MRKVRWLERVGGSRLKSDSIWFVGVSRSDSKDILKLYSTKLLVLDFFGKNVRWNLLRQSE